MGPPGFQKIKFHFIFNIKMSENFRRKAYLSVELMGISKDCPIAYFVT